jgi:hypothetical protein
MHENMLVNLKQPSIVYFERVGLHSSYSLYREFSPRLDTSSYTSCLKPKRGLLLQEDLLRLYSS